MSRFLGAHVPARGGLANAFVAAERLGCTAAQVFVKSPNRWAGRSLGKAETDAFRAAREAWGGHPVVAHAAYLVNLAAPDPAIRERSREGLADELERCDRLGIDALVVHPGAHGGEGEETGLGRVAESLGEVCATTGTGGCRLLLEVTAGQGTALGYRLEHLEAILAAVDVARPLGICLDTCHLFAAGYPMDEEEGVQALCSEVERRFGRERLGCIHINDSRHPRGSRRDRHANLGQGEIGEAGFAALLRQPGLSDVPMVVETPSGDDLAAHAEDLARLRRWAAG